MLDTNIPALRNDDGVIEGHVHYPQAWRASSHGNGRSLYLLMGDPLSGPIIWLGSLVPTTEGWGGGFGRRSPAHSHRTDTFRMALGNNPQQIKSNSVWLGDGDYSLLGANEVYVETAGAEGVGALLVYADRRGFNHGYEQNQENEALNARWTEDHVAAIFGEGTFFPIHLDDSEALRGVKVSFAELEEKRVRLIRSVQDSTGWMSLNDGSEVGAIFMAGEHRGPVVILSHNVPDAMESPSGAYSTDVFRVVVSGSTRVGDRVYRSREFRATPAGVCEGPVVHGPEGSTQILMMADRSGSFASQSEGGEVSQQSGQIDEIVRLFGLASGRLSVG